jgi:hypothetical protein
MAEPAKQLPPAPLKLASAPVIEAIVEKWTDHLRFRAEQFCRAGETPLAGPVLKVEMEAQMAVLAFLKQLQAVPKAPKK